MSVLLPVLSPLIEAGVAALAGYLGATYSTPSVPYNERIGYIGPQPDVPVGYVPPIVPIQRDTVTTISTPPVQGSVVKNTQAQVIYSINNNTEQIWLSVPVVQPAPLISHVNRTGMINPFALLIESWDDVKIRSGAFSPNLEMLPTAVNIGVLPLIGKQMFSNSASMRNPTREVEQQICIPLCPDGKKLAGTGTPSYKELDLLMKIAAVATLTYAAMKDIHTEIELVPCYDDMTASEKTYWATQNLPNWSDVE